MYYVGSHVFRDDSCITWLPTYYMSELMYCMNRWHALHNRVACNTCLQEMYCMRHCPVQHAQLTQIPLFIRFKMQTYWVFSADPAHLRPIPRLALHASLQGCISLSHTFPAHHAHSSIARGFPGTGCRVLTLPRFLCR